MLLSYGREFSIPQVKQLHSDVPYCDSGRDHPLNYCGMVTSYKPSLKVRKQIKVVILLNSWEQNYGSIVVYT